MQILQATQHINHGANRARHYNEVPGIYQRNDGAIRMMVHSDHNQIPGLMPDYIGVVHLDHVVMC
jgi:hypothetical protein